MTYRLKRIASALFLGLLLPVATFGQGLPGGASTLNETHGDWAVACAAPDGSPRCVISQSQVREESRQRVLMVELRAEANAANGMLVLPFGLDLDGGVTLAIDDAAAFQTLRFSTCLPIGCVVPLGFDADTLSALRAGSVITILANASDTGQDIAFSISLAGFASALARAADLNGL